mmetsp:Transcript_19906/g.24577  ORF Transcript_19906/g.24577 Transcript_19906/m.24577 type:complete len:392 (-) Transcript_19906:29-1204(-)
MPSALATNVRSTISSLLASLSSTETEADILRRLRDESSLLYQRQTILDAFDSDPLGAFDDDDDNGDDKSDDDNKSTPVKDQLRRLKSLINVSSHSRTSTREGHCAIEAVVTLDKDETTSEDVSHCVELTFRYERMPLRLLPSSSRSYVGSDGNVPTDGTETKERRRVLKEDGDGGGTTANNTSKKRKLGHDHVANDVPTTETDVSGTNISYIIELSRDYGKRECLLIVDVAACGEGPSRGAVAMEREAVLFYEGEDGDVMEDCDNGNDGMESEKALMGIRSGKAKGGAEEGHGVSENSDVMEIITGEDDGKDRYSAYVDPDQLTNFTSWTNLEFDVKTLILMLMTFPFYEHEWDLVEFVLDSVFEREEDSACDDILEEYDSNGELVVVDRL